MMMDANDWQQVNEALRDALGTSTAPDAGTVDAFLSTAMKAVRDGRTWPEGLTDHVLRLWVMQQQKQLAKQNATVLIDYRGRKITKSKLVGNRKRSENGATYHQQSLIHEMTWAEIDAYERMIRGQMKGLGANLEMVQMLRPLQERFPDSDGPAEALKALGMTFEQWMAQ